jgi:hypothetical protein
MLDYKKVKLISMYMYISELYESELQYTCQRFSNNSSPEFTDAELMVSERSRTMTVYLFVLSEQEYFKLKQIHRFTEEYLLDWFPKLPSYQGFVNRINRMSEAFKTLSMLLFTCFVPKDCDRQISLTDSLPIVTCKGKNRKGKVAKEVVDKGYCSTKNMYYYGLKLHLLAFRRPGTIPFPEFIGLTAASENDLTAFKELYGDQIYDRVIFGDRIFSDKPYFDSKADQQNIEMLTPIKLAKGEADSIRQREKAYRDLFGKAVSTIRQPVESFFNWLNEKTKIQEAQKVRSTNGLAVHVCGKMAAAFMYLIF